MASNYSTNLKIELITTGEQAGTWGETTNTNLGTALEESIVGKADISMSSTSVTLTASNSNNAQNFRALYLNLSGSPGGAAVLNVPAIQKNYIVYNGSDEQVTIKVAAQTGVAIPVGKTVVVYNNGSDVVTAIDHIPSLTLGAALPVASGGTGLATVTANNVLLGNGTSAFQEVAPGTSGNVLTSDGTTWASTTLPPGFDVGTRMIFAQSTAPTGWTKDTTNYDEHALRVTTGTAATGGSVDFTSALATPGLSGSISGTVGATTLTTSQIPSHTHGPGSGVYFITTSTGINFFSVASDGSYGQALYPTTTGSTGGGGSHTHSFTGDTGSATAVINVKYLDVITATKD